MFAAGIAVFSFAMLLIAVYILYRSCKLLYAIFRWIFPKPKPDPLPRAKFLTSKSFVDGIPEKAKASKN